MWICDKCSEKQPDSVSYCMSCKRNEKLERTRYLHNLMSSDLERIPVEKNYESINSIEDLFEIIDEIISIDETMCMDLSWKLDGEVGKNFYI